MGRSRQAVKRLLQIPEQKVGGLAQGVAVEMEDYGRILEAW
jgi:hypothetical protein